MTTNETYVIGTVDTRNFTFQALAVTKFLVDGALELAWQQHVKEYGADPDMMKELIEDGEVNYVEVPLNGATRDGELIYPKKKGGAK